MKTLTLSLALLLTAFNAFATATYADFFMADHALTITATQPTSLTFTTNTTSNDISLTRGQTFTYSPILKDSFFSISASAPIQAIQQSNFAGQFVYLNQFELTNGFEAFFSPVVSADVNIIAHANTTVTIINLNDNSTVAECTLRNGEQLGQRGAELFTAGNTYCIRTNVPATVQAGTLGDAVGTNTHQLNAINGTMASDTFYFSIPTVSMTQELFITSLAPNNTVLLERFVDGYWIELAGWNMFENETDEWIAAHYLQQYSGTMRITATGAVSVLASNGSIDATLANTERAYAATATNGLQFGKDFLLTLAPNADIQILGNATVTILDSTFSVHGAATFHIDSNTFTNLFNGSASYLTGMQRPNIQITADNNITLILNNTNSMRVAPATSNTQTAQVTVQANTVNPTNAEIMIYPNPVKTNATVTINSALGASTFLTNATIYNQAGQVVRNIHINQENSFTFSRNNMDAGLYYITVQTTGANHFTSALVIAD